MNKINFSDCQLESLEKFEKISFPKSNAFIENFLEEVKYKSNLSSEFLLQ